ncbi:MAG TPA: DUF5700 domain-containing putative Zn-dependent protease [Xanthomonadales bacterium]|nr:DUF5700 domain-containing putative Zn-dependent protease [Xanthomonadales bacterium]
MKRSAFVGGACAATFLPGLARAQLDPGDGATRLRLVPDEAQTVLAILARRAAGAAPDEGQWDALFATEGYRRLALRERSFNRPFDDATFRAFVMQPELLARRERLAETLASWSRADVRVCGQRALAYLPAGSRLRASVYPEIKPAPNSFVYDLKNDPGIFLYVDPVVTATEFTYTVAHELHHVGFAQNCPTPEVRAQIARLAPPLQRFERWLGAFGEGFAVLAGAGGPDIDPGSVVGPGARAEWATESATFAPRIDELTTFFRDVLSGRLADDAAVQAAAMTFFGNQGAWYTVGWRMAVTIERRFGRARLIECIADDRLFLPAYNAAAAGTALPRWSDDLAGAFTRVAVIS